MAGKKDIRLDLLTHDILIQDSDMQTVEGLDWLRQSVKIKLLFFFKEWFFDQSAGLDYFGLVYVKDPDINLIDNMIKIALTEYEEIIEILAYESQYNALQRDLSVEFTVSTVFGQLDFAGSVG